MAPSEIKRGKKGKKKKRLCDSRRKYLIKFKIFFFKGGDWAVTRPLKGQGTLTSISFSQRWLLAQLLQALRIQDTCVNVASPAPVQWPRQTDIGITLQGPARAPDSCLTQRRGISANHNRRSSHFALHFASSSLFKNLSGLVSCNQTCQFCAAPSSTDPPLLPPPEGDTYHRVQL